MTSAILEAHSLARSYGSFTAVRDLSFDANAGEVIGLLGPNGAGKTTAIRVLTTILTPTRGSFRIAGIPHTKAASIRQRVGVLPESAGYPLHQTGEEFIRYHGRLYGHSAKRANEIASALLAEVGLEERATSTIGTYSRGMRQRLGVARALVNEPEVIFLDEPTLGLDPGGQRQILALIRQVAQHRGAAVILSTHFLDEVEGVCARAIIMHRGAVVAQGTIDEIKREAATGGANVRVPRGLHERAAAALRAVKGILVRPGEERDVFVIAFDGRVTDADKAVAGKDALKALLEADVPVLSYELEGGRLSDAFFALTGEANL